MHKRPTCQGRALLRLRRPDWLTVLTVPTVKFGTLLYFKHSWPSFGWQRITGTSHSVECCMSAQRLLWRESRQLWRTNDPRPGREESTVFCTIHSRV